MERRRALPYFVEESEPLLPEAPLLPLVLGLVALLSLVLGLAAPPLPALPLPVSLLVPPLAEPAEP